MIITMGTLGGQSLVSYNPTTGQHQTYTSVSYNHAPGLQVPQTHIPQFLTTLPQGCKYPKPTYLSFLQPCPRAASTPNPHTSVSYNHAPGLQVPQTHIPQFLTTKPQGYRYPKPTYLSFLQPCPRAASTLSSTARLLLRYNS